MAETERIQVVLPKQVAGDLRKRVPARKRSAFIAESVANRLLAERRRELLTREEPGWSDADYPYLNTSEDIRIWLRAIRSGEDAEALLQEHYRKQGFRDLDDVAVFRAALRDGKTETQARWIALGERVAEDESG